jgi:hypothetical protein
MAKKLLNEAQVRRFMGLAGMQSNLVSNYLKEAGMHYEEEEDMSDAEMPPAEEPEMDMGADEPAELEGPAEEPEMDEPGEVDLSQDEIDAAAEAMDALQSVMDKLSGAASEEEPAADMEEPMADEPEMDMDADEPADEEGGDVLEGVELELSEDEVVAEVARRVAKRIMEAKRAQNKMNKALGRRRK